MATASPLDYSRSRAPETEPESGIRIIELGRAYAEHLRETQPEHFASLGGTVEEVAARFTEPGLTIDESVAAGHMSAAEGRYLQRCATREDLEELGCSLEEIEAILAEQQACASSS